jgi:TnpA family transposase
VKRHWDEQELAERWSLTDDEFELVRNRTDRGRIGFAAMLKFFQVEGRFPSDRREVPTLALDYLARRLEVSREAFADYDVGRRSAKRDRVQIRKLLGFRQVTVDDSKQLADWLSREVLPVDHNPDHLREAALEWCRRNRIEPPTPARMQRILGSALQAYETDFFKASYEKIHGECRAALHALLLVPEASNDTGRETSPFSELRADPGRVSLESILKEIAKFKRIAAVALPDDLFASVPSKILQKYRARAAGERPSQLRRHGEPTRCTLLAAFCWQRRKEITDGLVDLFVQVVHRIGVRSEKKVVKMLLEDLKKIHGKTTLLFKIAEAAVESPNGVIKEVLYPLVGEDTLRDLVREYKATGAAYEKEVYRIVRRSYGNHYRRMLGPLLETLEFRSNNALHRPVIDALELLKAHRESNQRYFSVDEGVPIDGVVQPKWRAIVLEKDKNGVERINRINYEICVLQVLRKHLRTKEVWVVGADRYRNPDDDLPSDFEVKREEYYAELKQPEAAEEFVAGLKRSMAESLERFNNTFPTNQRVRIIQRGKQRISITKIDPQPEPLNLSQLKAEVTRRWPMTSLLDVLKETDLRVGFTEEFRNIASREVLDRDEVQKRLLLSLYGLGTNTGLKRVSASDLDISYDDLLYVRRRFIQKDSLRRVIATVANSIFRVRLPEIWGEGTTACASDSKKFGAWDQNLMTEWHIRYCGRGVMIYWHVEKKSVCIYSQLKRCSSSEVAAMIEGLLRHCTEMSVEKNYVDSHGQSDVAFAFCHFLGFDLLPRLKGISKKKLYRAEPGSPGDYPNLQPILSRPINWDLIARQYDEMVKYATALRLGTAETEAILSRFTRDNLKHPTYQALLELGKVKRTMFLCRYLESEALRQEVHEALNVIERWNGTNSFIFFGKGGEVATNRLDDQEISVLCLHLLQIALVYVNTLMIQNVLADEGWLDRMAEEDFRALTPLIHNHVNPYGSFKLDMAKRLPLDEPAALVA